MSYEEARKLVLLALAGLLAACVVLGLSYAVANRYEVVSSDGAAYRVDQWTGEADYLLLTGAHRIERGEPLPPQR